MSSEFQKPFSTYPEDRELMMSLARTIQTSPDVEVVDQAAGKLSDLVLAILSDEATNDFDCELDADELRMIDQAWETYTRAFPRWNPIDTAPRDGQDILLTSKEWNGDVVVGGFHFGAWRENAGLYCLTMTPTHWMPVPVFNAAEVK